jgi:hypothetical protein
MQRRLVDEDVCATNVVRLPVLGHPKKSQMSLFN